jgi:hypothetical protein
MHYRKIMLRFAIIVLALACAWACLGCNKTPADSSTAPSSSKKAKRIDPNDPQKLAKAVSLFVDTKLLDTVPLDLDINRAGTSVFVQFLPRETDAFQIIQLGVDAEGKVTPKNQLYSSPAQNRAYVRANPDRDECIILDNAQETPKSPVVDTVWRAVAGNREAVNYLYLVPNFSALPPESCYALEPIFTWDGTAVIVPLKSAGLCYANYYGSGSEYFNYPAIDFEAVGITAQALPDQNGRRVAVLRWSLGDPQLEKTQIDVLNLDTKKWEASVRVPWPVYEMSAKDIVNGPWLISGSRFPEVNTEKKRMPRLARVDPATSAMDLIEFYGEPYWNVRLDSTGSFVVYMDQQRKALVRLNLLTGALDIDPTWFEPEAELFISPDADPVYAWKGNILYRAKWSKHEQYPGLEAE